MRISAKDYDETETRANEIEDCLWLIKDQRTVEGAMRLMELRRVALLKKLRAHRDAVADELDRAVEQLKGKDV